MKIPVSGFVTCPPPVRPCLHLIPSAKPPSPNKATVPGTRDKDLNVSCGDTIQLTTDVFKIYFCEPLFHLTSVPREEGLRWLPHAGPLAFASVFARKQLLHEDLMIDSMTLIHNDTSTLPRPAKTRGRCGVSLSPKQTYSRCRLH